MSARHVLPVALMSLATSALAMSALAAQQAPPGYSTPSAATERAYEAAAIAIPSAKVAREQSRILSREVHVAGTIAQARTRDSVIAWMKAMGLETEVREYSIWMPHPTVAKVWRVSPAKKELALAEPALKEDPTSQLPQYPTVNGYSGAGDATGEVAYVNYGLVEDYATLEAAGISVKGKVVLARYGRSFRGIKAREAEKHGAIALLIYSDPADDGFVQGDVYPEGAWRSEHGVQRGSVMNTNGDPTTPGYASVAGAKRVPFSEMQVPHIPVIPISYGNAAELLKGVRGKALPTQQWQGGLPFRYHVGPGPVQARVLVQNDTAKNAYKKIWDTFGIIRGTDYPDEIVMVGAHRDAWDGGTSDNISGTVSVLEAARAAAEAVKQGFKPKRTMIFATWDAEEWGLIGSTEYVEDDTLRLVKGAVAYLNQDVAAGGPNFGGGGSPSLRALLRDVAKVVPDPAGNSVYANWRARAKLASDTLEPRMGDPGGGSDFAGFANHLGLPTAEWGFGGTGGGVYHSAYDTYAWMTRFGDTSYAYHATAAKIGIAAMLRLANADLHPYDYVEFARTMKGYLPGIDAAISKKGLNVPTTSLGAAIDHMETAARAWSSARDASLAGAMPAKEILTRANASLRGVEKALTRPEGLRTRPWFRSLTYAADEDNGYANMALPSVGEAVRRGGAALVETEVADLAKRFEAAAAKLDEARGMLVSR